MPVPSLDGPINAPVVLPVQVSEDPVLVLEPAVDFRQGRGGGRRGRGGGSFIFVSVGEGRQGGRDEQGTVKDRRKGGKCAVLYAHMFVWCLPT
jgi:hypothetical protein